MKYPQEGMVRLPIPPGTQPAGGRRVLLVEDEPRLRATQAELLQLAGMTCLACGTGAEALKITEREICDAAVVDLLLPDMSGLQLIEALRGRDALFPVIVTSGESSLSAAVESFRRGAFDFLRKPAAPDELLGALERAIEQCRGAVGGPATLYRYLVDNSPDLIYTLDRDGRFSFVNERAQALLGYSRDALLGQHYSFLVHDEDLERAHRAFDERRTGERATRNLELRLKCHDGTGRFVAESFSYITAVLNASGIYIGERRAFCGSYGVVRDISDRKQAEESLSYQAWHDLLTDLPNRALFKDRLGVAMNQSQRTGRPLAVMFLDLDGFKAINDSLGHLVGDEFLKGVASRLKASLRKGDTLARVGGDEFMLLLPQVNSREDAAKAARKVLETMRRPIPVEGHELSATLSIGIALYPADADTIDTLIRNADLAMYHAKWGGKNAFRFYSAAMAGALVRAGSLESDLRRALDEDELEVYYQPQVDVVDRAVVGMEALVRWRHPVRGLLLPDQFLPLAEEAGLTGAIGQRVLEQVCAQIQAWRVAGVQPRRVAVNLAAEDLDNAALVESVLRLLARHGIEAGTLELEFSESALSLDTDGASGRLRTLAALGVRLVVDGFGTHYGSLGYLGALPIDGIKMDQAIVADLAEGRPQAPVAAAVAAVAHSCGKRLIAEAVETREQMEALRALDCRLMQGFLFGPPMSAQQSTEMLAAPDSLFRQVDGEPPIVHSI